MKKIIGAFLILFLSIGLISCSKAVESSAKEVTTEEKEKLEEYIENNTDDICEKTDNKSYSAFEILGVNKDEVYIWLLKANDISVVSIPVQLKVNEDFEVIGHKYPGDGADYKEDLEELFPKNIRKKIDNKQNDYIKKLEKEIDEERAMNNS